jgi:lipoprotein-releasing system permease protein
MFSVFERLVAFRYLRARRQEGFISIIAWFSLLGITLGVATLIIVMAVMNGFREELLTRVLGLNGHINIAATERQLMDFDDLADRVRATEGVAVVTPIIEAQVMASANNIASGAVVRGLRAADFAAKPILAGNLKAGSMEQFSENRGIFLGTRLARRMALSVGDHVTLISPNGNPSAFGTVPRMKAYRVVGTVEIGMFEYDNNFIYMPLALAQQFFRLRGAVSSLEIVLNNADDARATRLQIGNDLGPIGYVRDWQQVHSSFFTALQVERNVMFLILTLIILIAAFNIVSSQIMLVNDKSKGIAILRTLGATRGMILRIFFITGASVGVAGTVAGSILGVTFALNIESIRRSIEMFSDIDLFQAEIYFLSQLPAKIENAEVILVIGMALALSFLASIYPAWRAARLDPVELLRYE